MNNFLLGDAKANLEYLKGANFQTVVADPPWAYSGDVAKSKSPQWKGIQVDLEYTGSMDNDAIRALPVKDVVAPNAHLYLWITNGFLLEPDHPAYTICEAWGFTPKTVLTWFKTQKGQLLTPSRKVGVYLRGATEHCIFAVRGSCPPRTKANPPATWFPADVPEAMLHPRIRNHSAKPPEFFDLVDHLSPEGPKLSIFDRTDRGPDWIMLGDQRSEALP